MLKITKVSVSRRSPSEIFLPFSLSCCGSSCLKYLGLQLNILLNPIVHIDYCSVQNATEILLVGLLVVMEESIEFLLENQF